MGGIGGMIQPIPGIGPIGGRIAGDILTGGLAEAMPRGVREPLYHGMGSLLFSPASGLAAGGAGLLGAGGIGGGGFGAAGGALPEVGSTAVPAAGGGTLVVPGSSYTPASFSSAGGVDAASKAGMSKSDMLQNAFLATSIGGMLGNAIKPPPLYPPAGIPAPPIGHSSGFTPVASNASQQWAQLMAQRRAQQTGKFTV